jgi:hypothetical protein
MRYVNTRAGKLPEMGGALALGVKGPIGRWVGGTGSPIRVGFT